MKSIALLFLVLFGLNSLAATSFNTSTSPTFSQLKLTGDFGSNYKYTTGFSKLPNGNYAIKISVTGYYNSSTADTESALFTPNQGTLQLRGSDLYWVIDDARAVKVAHGHWFNDNLSIEPNVKVNLNIARILQNRFILSFVELQVLQ